MSRTHVKGNLRSTTCTCHWCLASDPQYIMELAVGFTRVPIELATKPRSSKLPRLDNTWAYIDARIVSSVPCHSDRDVLAEACRPVCQLRVWLIIEKATKQSVSPHGSKFRCTQVPSFNNIRASESLMSPKHEGHQRLESGCNVM
jgi:hypothetical protein